MCCKRKSENQSGSSQSGNTWISACIQHNCKIPQATPIFSRSINSKKAFFHTVWCKLKSEIQYGGFKRWNITSSACIQHPCKIPEAINMHFEIEKFRWAVSHNANGYQQSKMSDHKPEILISQSVHKIADQFQRLYPCFQGPEIQRNFFLMCDASGRQKSNRVTHQQEILRFVSRHLGFLTYRASHTFMSSSSLKKHRYCRWNFAATMCTVWDVSISGL